MNVLLSDVDGTLLGYDHTIRKEDIEAIRKWQEAGNWFGLVTGRDRTFCSRLLGAYGLENDVMITGNGSDAYVQKESVFSDGLDKDAVKQCFAFCLLSPDSIVPFVTLENGWHYFPSQALNPERMERMKSEQAHLRYFHPMDALELLETDLLVPKFSIYVRESSQTDAWLKKIKEQFPAYNVMKTSIDYIEITKKGVDKAKAFAHLSQALPDEVEEIAFIGDGANDVPLFQSIKASYIMDHADLPLRKYAQSIVSSVQEAIEQELRRGKENV